MESNDKELESLLPHAPPMILLSGCEPEGADGSASAWVDVSESSPFFDFSAGGVPGCTALEYMAQTMALLVGRNRRKAGLPPAVGFVLGSRRMEVAIPFFKRGCRYLTHAQCTYSDEAFASFACSVEDSGGNTVASAELTAFQPDDGNMTK